MRKRGSRNAVSKLLIIIIITLLLLTFSIHYYLKRNGTTILNNYFSTLEQKSGGAYSILADFADIDLLGSCITIKKLQILEKKKTGVKNNFPDSRFLMRISFINIKGVSLIKLILFKSLSGKSLYLSDGEINYKSIKKLNNTGDLPPAAGSLKKVFFKNFVADKISIKIFREDNVLPLLNFPAMNLSVKSIGLKLKREEKKNFLLKFGDINLEAKDSTILFPKISYKADIANLKIKNSSLINLDGIKYIQFFPEDISGRKKGKKPNKYSLSISEIALKNISLEDLINEGTVSIGSVLIKGPELDIERNRNLVRTRRRKEKKLPQQILREAKLIIKTDLLQIKNGSLKYKEIARGQWRGESIWFTEINTRITNITNHKSIMRSGIESKVEVSAKLMGKSLLKGKIIIPVNNRNDQFFFSGSLSKTDPKILNRFLIRNSRIKINKGLVKELTFSVKADRERSEGNMKLIYNNLKISLLRKKDIRKKRKLYTFIANTILYESNPSRKKRKHRKGRIKFLRVQKRSIFNYMWKSILSGIKSTIGL